MNQTNLEHAVVAVIVQVVVFVATGDWWLGAALGAGLFLGREHAQAENRYMAATGHTYDDSFPELACFSPRWWSRDAVLDFVAPAAAVCAVALLAT